MPDPRAQLVAEYLPLVRSLARRYAGRGEPLDDLEQVGVIGLMKAIDRFDAAKGDDLRAFAIPMVLGEIRRHFRDRAWVISVPRTVKDAYYQVSRAVETIQAATGRSATVADIAAETGLPEDLILDAITAGSAYRPASIARPAGDQTVEVAAADDAIDELIERTGFDAAISGLSRTQRQVLHLRFVDDLTQTQIAVTLGVSQMQVSRLLRSGLTALRDEHGDDFLG